MASATTAFASPGTGAHHTYTVRLDPSALTLDVVARLTDKRGGHRLRAADGQRSDLERIRGCPAEPQTEGTTTPNKVVRRGAKSYRVQGNCVNYVVQLAPMEGRLPLPWSSTTWASRPSRFMWLPDDGLPIKVIFDTQGLELSAPWQRTGPNEWWIYPAAKSGRSVAIFGGTPLDLGLDQPGVLVGDDTGLKRRQDIEAWLKKYLYALDQMLGGHFSREIQIVAVDVGASGRSAIPFGHVVREQGQSVRFYVDQDASLARLTADWTGPHELAHLLLPYVDARWISEGFASYYQNVLLARTGEITPQRAWDKYRERFSRAQAEGRRVTPASSSSRLLTYWSGAALALRLDLELRARGSSLDEVLRDLAICCLPAREVWSAQKFAAKLDELSGYELALPLVRRYQHRRGMPPIQGLFARENASSRAAIMQPIGPDQG